MCLSPNYECMVDYISEMFTYFNPPDTCMVQTQTVCKVRMSKIWKILKLWCVQIYTNIFHDSYKDVQLN